MINGRRYYRCRGYNKEVCPSVSIPADELEAVIEEEISKSIGFFADKPGWFMVEEHNPAEFSKSYEKEIFQKEMNSLDEEDFFYKEKVDMLQEKIDSIKVPPKKLRPVNLKEKLSKFNNKQKKAVYKKLLRPWLEITDKIIKRLENKISDDKLKTLQAVKEKERPFINRKELEDRLKKSSFTEKEIKIVVSNVDFINAIKFDIYEREGEITVYVCNQIYSETIVIKFSLSQK